ncbi:MAG: L-threonine 3-dehydrogenase [Clostridia bacterium]|jgi:threonine 3-dehydrogenase|nr:L-threonine 3-dehydrogenase [Clostridia bacterium]MBR6774057.1 L-threonine 3-dehydrogenase [Clostridia bacterium]
MKALVKKFPQRGLWFEDVPEPQVGRNDVKIKIHKTAICGTDLHIYNWDEWSQRTIQTPRVIGHEYVGEIVEVGENVRNWKVGDLVSGEGHIVCGRCRNCLAGNGHLCKETVGVGVNRDGAFAEYLVIPEQNVRRCEEGIDEEMYSIFDPFGNAVHTALSFNLTGEDVLITGAGPIGIMAGAICKFVGARHVVITDINDERLALARKLGIKYTVNTAKESLKETMDKILIKEGFDVGLEMSGSEIAFNTMIDNMVHGGRIALLGLLKSDAKIDWSKVIFNGLIIKGIYGREMHETWYKMSAMLQGGLDISQIITHRFDIRDYEKGFEAMNSAKCGKVILDWTNLHKE